MKELTAILIILLLLVPVLLHYKAFAYWKWARWLIFRTSFHVVLLGLVAAGVFAALHSEPNSIAQKLAIKLSFGALLFWVTPFCLKLLKHDIGIVVMIFIPIVGILYVCYLGHNELINEYCLELSIGAAIVFLLEYYFKNTNKAMKDQMARDYIEVIESINKRNKITVEKQEAELAKQKEELDKIERKYADEDYMHAYSDFLGLPRSFSLAGEGSGDNIEGVIVNPDVKD